MADFPEYARQLGEQLRYVLTRRNQLAAVAGEVDPDLPGLFSVLTKAPEFRRINPPLPGLNTTWTIDVPAPLLPAPPEHADLLRRCFGGIAAYLKDPATVRPSMSGYEGWRVGTDWPSRTTVDYVVKGHYPKGHGDWPRDKDLDLRQPKSEDGKGKPEQVMVAITREARERGYL